MMDSWFNLFLFYYIQCYEMAKQSPNECQTPYLETAVNRKLDEWVKLEQHVLSHAALHVCLNSFFLTW